VSARGGADARAVNTTDLSGTCSVTAFFRACATASVDLHAFRRAWGLAYGDLLDRGYHGTSDCQLAPYEVVGGQPHAPDCNLRIPLGLPFPPPCAPALVACGAVPPGWPEAAAQRLVDAMLRRQAFRPQYPPDWGPLPDLDTLFTDATGRIVYRDGFDDLRLWMEELGITEDWEPLNPPGSLAILVESVSMRQLTDRIGPDRMRAFVTKLREEGPGLGNVSTYYFRVASRLGRYAALRYEDVALLEQAHQDAASAREGNAVARALGETVWPDEPTLNEDE
jgi:hypothetical protein